MERVLVTGDGGFVGRHLTSWLRGAGYGVVRAVHDGRRLDVTDDAGWAEVLRSVDAVIHLAGRAHVINDVAPDPLREFRRINVDGTLRVAHHAAVADVRRFVYVSSIGVLGDESGRDAFTHDSPVRPTEPYAISKWEAEQSLRAFGDRSNLEVVIVRPPLVHGPGVKGNMARLLQLADTPMALPLACVRNQRSFVGIENLCALLTVCAFHSRACSETFLVADAEVISTPSLMGLLREQMGRPARLVPCPLPVVDALASLAGRRHEFRRLCGSLLVDTSYTQQRLGWRPTVSLREGMARMVQAYLEQRA